MNNRKILIAGGVSLLSFAIIPNIIFIAKFGDQPISENPSDWETFAGFFTGIVNPIAAIFGTFILGFLSLQVAKQGADENQRLFLLEQRILAYQKLAVLLQEFEMRYESSKGFNMFHGALKEVMSQEESTKQYIKTTEALIGSLVEIRAMINNFPVAYGHLFQYDFNSDEYKNLQNILSDYLHDIKTPLYKVGANKEDIGLNNLRQRKIPGDTNIEEPVLQFLKKLNREIERDNG